MRFHVTTASLVLAAIAAAPAAHAAASYDSCVGFIDTLPAAITTQGTWCLRKDLATAIASGNAITIATNNVTLDCNGFKVGGLQAGAGTETVGIRAFNRNNVVVTGCNFRGFYIGVHLEGSRHVVEHNRFDGMTDRAIQVQSFPGLIRDNLIYDTGMSPRSAPFAVLAAGEVDVIDNTIDGVNGAVAGSQVVGIYSAGHGNVIAGNRVRNLANTGAAGFVYGIETAATAASHTVLRDNVVVGNSLASDAAGIYCAFGNSNIARDNQLSGWADGSLNCGGSGNDELP